MRPNPWSEAAGLSILDQHRKAGEPLALAMNGHKRHSTALVCDKANNLRIKMIYVPRRYKWAISPLGRSNGEIAAKVRNGQRTAAKKDGQEEGGRSGTHLVPLGSGDGVAFP
jgi:hypothetical protein